MKITGIVAEYNPFHMGHEYQLKKAREVSSCDGIVVVMSGNYVQRGEPAIIDKFKRAEAAIYGGADLVIELPPPFSSQNAEMFAHAAIGELKKLPVSAISFGCENDDTVILKEIAKLQLTEKFHETIKKEIKSGISYPSALSNTISSQLGEKAATLASSPNNVLGIEYIKSMMKYNLNWEIAPVKRKGKDHNDASSSGYFDSATAIRQLVLKSSFQNISVPEKSKESIHRFYQEQQAFNCLNNYLDILYFEIIRLGPGGLMNIYEVTEGLNNKIYSNVFRYSNVDDLIMSLKSKRYTYSKLRRMLLNIILGITDTDIKYFMLPNSINSVKVLSFNDTGRQIINEAKDKIAFINRYSDYRKHGIDANNLPLFKLTDKGTNLYYLPFKDRKFSEEYKSNSVYVKI